MLNILRINWCRLSDCIPWGACNGYRNDRTHVIHRVSWDYSLNPEGPSAWISHVRKSPHSILTWVSWRSLARHLGVKSVVRPVIIDCSLLGDWAWTESRSPTQRTVGILTSFGAAHDSCGGSVSETRLSECNTCLSAAYLENVRTKPCDCCRRRSVSYNSRVERVLPLSVEVRRLSPPFRAIIVRI